MKQTNSINKMSDSLFINDEKGVHPPAPGPALNNISRHSGIRAVRAKIKIHQRGVQWKQGVVV